MFKTKLEVDRHVDNSLKKINNETERNLRCFQFAKLYFNVGDYDQACRYISSYLSVKPKSAEGHHLLGKALEKLGKKDAALESYRKSLQIDPKQNSLVIKVCELLASDDVDMDKAGARYFCDLAQTFDPHNSAVFNLKERLITTENENPYDVSQLLLKELDNRPTDVNLRVRLLKHFLQHNLIKEAYKHASDIESKNLAIFHNNLNWYETFAEVLVRYQRCQEYSSSITWEFWFLSVSVLDRLVSLSLDEHIDNVKTSSEYISTIFNFDQMLSTATSNVDSCPDRHLAMVFQNHYQAQLYFHFATAIFKQAKKDLIQFKEASNITLPVLLAAYHTQPPDLQSIWINNLPENRRNLVTRWHKEAAYRCSQTGHVLISAAKERKSIVLEKASQYSTGMWREQLFKKLFVKRDQQSKMNSSYFVNGPTILDNFLKLPEISEVLKYDETAQFVFPDSLHHHIWMAQNNNLADVKLKCFEGLAYSVKNLNSCSAESLSVLDIQAFIYCATLCAKSKLENSKNHIFYNSDKPNVLPAAITEDLGTVNQSKFLISAYKMFKNEQSFNAGEVRLLLIKGLEVVRCVGHHGLDAKLLVTLANIFSERSKRLMKQSEIEFNDARTELYWRTALPLLEKLKNNQAITYSSNRLFEYKSKNFTMSEIVNHIESGKLFTAIQFMKKKDYDNALSIFEMLKDPYASFYQSQIYKLLADQKTNQNKENVTSEMRSQNIILLSKARDCLYLTLDRLREPSVDRTHPLNTQLGSEIEKMERLLSRIDPDCINRNECDGMSDENVSSDSAGEHYITSYNHHSSFHNGPFTPKHEPHNNHSTPYRSEMTRREARPSPERLDAQLRQLAATKDFALNHILEQNKFMADTHTRLLEELRSFKDAVNNLTATVDDLKTMKHGLEELKEIKTSVQELKHSVDDLQNVVDVVQEMKKEINELKKDSSKNNQLSDEDLYVLDPDYGVEYGLNTNLGQYNPNMYPNYQGRLSAATSLAANSLAAVNSLTYPPGMYPGIYPAAMAAAYAYGGTVLPQANSLPYLADQQIPGYPPQVGIGQTNLPPTVPLPNSSLGIGMLTGQSLSQGLQTTQGFVKEIPKATLTTLTSTIQSTFPSMSAISSSSSSTIPTNKNLPVNVVITSSDPLPTIKTVTSQPVLSVTIPPQHLKGNVTPKVQPHNYQIPLPSTANSTITTTPSVLSKPPPVISTQSLLSNVAPPVFSAVSPAKTPSKNVSLGIQIEKSLDQTFSPNKSNTSNVSLEEHDPRPDFKPIIPLPDEVPVTTGEESETVLFCERAKLFRHVNINDNKEWRERGVGNLKILYNPETGKIRILMRRDQVHKICANHYLTKDMTLTPMLNNGKTYIWAAHDFADEEMVLEKFCVRFKTAEDATKFYTSFEEAKKKLCQPPSNKTVQNSKFKEPAKENTPTSVATTVKKEVQISEAGKSLGGFSFSATPTFKPKDTAQSSPITTWQVKQDSPKTASPFSNFTFGAPKTTISSVFTPLQTEFKPVSTSSSNSFSPVVIPTTSASDTVDENDQEEFVPNAEFTPVIALPDLVEVKTGEENAEILFECRAKLFRLCVNETTKEWKERGIGIIKVLKEDTIRLVMRRDQVHKVCLNHQIIKNMIFKINNNNPKAVVWSAKDFSEGVLIPETFTARFKTEEEASKFLKVIQTAQVSLNESGSISSKHHKGETSPKAGFGNKFKTPKGSWECKVCLVVNEGKVNHCVACDTPKNDTIPKKTEDSGKSGAAFSFGAKNINTSESQSPGSFVFGQKPISSTWGDAFKPAQGSWECKICYLRNEGDQTKCISCETSKDGVIPTQSSIKGINLETPGQKFTFGIATATVTSTETKPTGFGDAFKMKEGTWECKSCLVRNNSGVKYCVSCESPKDDTVPKKEKSQGINLDTPGQKFTFGMPSISTTTTDTAKPFSFGNSAATKPAQFDFGKPDSVITTTNIFDFTPATNFKTEEKKSSGDSYMFGSPVKHDFEFTPRSPSRRISAGQGDEESDGSYVEEEADNIYFKPVIPLPDKVDVKTGEEEEDVLYCQRAKLFRFVSGEWKERGIGDLKILKRKSNGKLRVVMRREQVFKICLNHVLTQDVEYRPKDEKTWLFYAADFSEGEINHEQFCLRFKNPEIALEFKKAVEGALDSSSNNAGNKGTSSDDEVEVVSETKVSPEEMQEATRLGLPPKFMSYKQLPDCQCEQCIKDDEYLKELFTDGKEKPSLTSFSNIFGNSTPKTFNNSGTSLFQTPSSQTATPSSGDSVFGTPNQTFSFTKGKDVTLKDLLTKPKLDVSSKVTSTPTTNVFGASTNTSNISSTPPVTNTSTFGFNTSTDSNSNLHANQNTGNSTFGQKPIFGTTPTNASAKPIFGVIPTNASATPIFGVTPSTTSTTSTTASTTPIFGVTTTIASATPIFGVTTTTASATPIFGANSPFIKAETLSSSSSGTNLFGNTSSSSVFSKGIFSSNLSSCPSTGSLLATTTSSSTSIFGNSLFPTTSPSVFSSTTNITTSSNIFGTNTSTSSFFGTSKSPSLSGGITFGGQANLSFGTSSNIFGNKIEEKPDATSTIGNQTKTDTTKLKETDDVVLKCKTEISFATLAANTSDKPAFTTKEDGSTPFSFLGAGAPVFGSKTIKKLDKSAADKSKTESDNENETQPEEEYDPHYEPIVPLPDTIVVTTGEENEVALFDERAKLYRYDGETKEWKERGVGQMKVLHHPENRTYRLLLRREQVHKVVLNQLIIAELEIQPLASSDKAWMWAGMNYTDDGQHLEKLAIRFKNCELSQKFQEVVNLAICRVVEINNQRLSQIPTTVDNIGRNSDEDTVTIREIHEDEEDENYDENDDEDDDDEDDDDDDTKSVMCSKRCTLSAHYEGEDWKKVGMGELEIYYDSDLYASKINITDDNGQCLSNTIIGLNTLMDRDGKECSWKAVEWGDVDNMRWRYLRATFSSENSAQEFYDTYLEGLNYAQEVGITDELPTDED